MNNDSLKQNVVVFNHLVEASITDAKSYGAPVQMESPVCTDKIANVNAPGEIQTRNSGYIRARAARLATATGA